MFKYSGVSNYALENLKNNQIYLSDPKDFNDPFETKFIEITCKPMSNDVFTKAFIEQKDPKKQFKESDIQKLMNDKFSKEEFHSFIKNHYDYLYVNNKSNKEQFFKKFDENYEETKKLTKIKLFGVRISMDIERGETVIKKLNDEYGNVGISCFSEEMNNLLMWSHYADKHAGFCIEFDSSYHPFLKARKVIYTENIPDYNYDLEKKNNQMNLFNYKSKYWEYEKELRIIDTESNKCLTYEKESLKAIYFGLKTNKKNKERICSIAKDNNPEVKFYEMKIKDGYFELESHPYLFSIEEKQYS